MAETLNRRHPRAAEESVPRGRDLPLPPPFLARAAVSLRRCNASIFPE
jgi:hypothetical protein